MQFLRVTKNICKSGENRKLKGMFLFKIFQTCFYLMLIDGLLKMKVFCAVSPEIDFINEMVIDKYDELFDEEKDHLLLEGLKKQIKREYSKMSKTNREVQPIPSTTESNQFQSNSNLFEDKIGCIESDFNLLLNVKVPERLKDLNRLNNLYNFINQKINIIKEIPQPYISAFIKRIEKKIQEKQKINDKFEQTLNDMILSTEKIKLSFEDIVCDYSKMKSALFFIGSKIIEEYGNTFIDKTDAENKRLFKILSDAELALTEDKLQADSILMILSKFLVMAQEDFNADHEVINAIWSLK
ncbi:hypothetical protein NBO_66g0037 [Nosema bombycis CQ1]|uniref:Uncharacterized protein n=1 Tax=Nosema bombycis (strain CQ1 / CVCC 102059) TaxID=578461 RepID=R0ML83_NOSB1|nr:hypothetical protein NBO_66g0037 [Nosema bombycis CQ1]|eukprot:EOB13578.1 hypothetical protein NBO_66g0037 [Nosema bombycis CQ1]